MKKVIILISLMFILGGCYNYKELNNYSIATGMAIDYEDNKYEVSMLISNSSKNSSEQGSSYQTVVYSGEGKTIYEAIKNVGLISPKEIYIGHLSVIVISENTAKEGLYKSLDFLLEEPRSKKNFYVVLAKGDKAKDVLSITTPLSDFPSQTLADNIQSTDLLQGSVVAIDFNTLMYDLLNEGIDPVLNGFKVVGDAKDGAKASNVETNLPKAYLKLTSLGIFKGDKLIKWATQDESRGINIVNDKTKESYVQTKCQDGYIVINTEKISSEVSVDKEGNVAIEINGHGLINEVTCDVDLNDQKTIDGIEKKAENKIKKFVKKAINLSKETKADLFGIGHKFYQDHPKEYQEIENWDEYLTTIDYDVKVKIDLNHTGSIQQSIERITNEENN